MNNTSASVASAFPQSLFGVQPSQTAFGFQPSSQPSFAASSSFTAPSSFAAPLPSSSTPTQFAPLNQQTNTTNPMSQGFGSGSFSFGSGNSSSSFQQPTQASFGTGSTTFGSFQQSTPSLGGGPSAFGQPPQNATNLGSGPTFGSLQQTQVNQNQPGFASSSSPFNPFSAPTQANATSSPASQDAKPNAFPAPFATQSSPAPKPFGAPTTSTPNPFAAVPLTISPSNPFAAASSTPNTFAPPASVPKTTDNALSTSPKSFVNGDKSTFNRAPSPAKSVSGADSSTKTFGAAKQPASHSRESREARFNDSTGLGDSYEQLVEQRAKERQSLIAAGVIDDPEVQKPLEEAKPFHGTCTTMCPKFECVQREYQKMVDRLELTDGKPDYNRFVKSFHRPAAGIDAPLPCDVRTPKALVETLHYLIEEILGKYEWQECQGFVRDRTRSIRQDFTYQNYEGDEIVACTEIIIRFHLLGLYLYPDNEEYMELEQLDKSLTTLSHLYKHSQLPDAQGNYKRFPNEAEFRSYMILRKINDGYIEREDFTKWPEEVRNSEKVKHAIRINQAAQKYQRSAADGLYSMHYANTFFELVMLQETDFITACLLGIYFADIRRFALQAMAMNYMKTSKMTSVQFIKDFLYYETTDDAIAEMEHYNLEVAVNTVDGVANVYMVPGKDFDANAPKIKTKKHPSILEPKKDIFDKITTLLLGPKDEIETFKWEGGAGADEEAMAELVEHDSPDTVENEGFFDIREASAGEIVDEEYINDIGAPHKRQSFSPYGQPLQGKTFSSSFNPAASVFVPPQTKSVFDQPKPNPFAAAQATASAFSGQSVPNPFATVTPSASFSGPSVPNPFAPAPAWTPQFTAPSTSAPAPQAGGSEGKSMFDRISTSSQDKASEKPLFIGAENDVTDEEDEEDEAPPPPSGPSWTSFLPGKANVPSTQPGAPSVFDNPSAPSVFDKLRQSPPKTFQFGSTPFTANGPSNAATPTLFAPKVPEAAGISDDALAREKKEKEEAEAREKLKQETMLKEAQMRQALLKEKEERELREKQEREAAMLREKQQREKALLREQQERREALLREEKEREEAAKRAFFEQQEQKALEFHDRHLSRRIFYPYLKEARRRKLRTERKLRQQRAAEFAEDRQWWPIIKDGSLYKEPVQKVSEKVFKSAELEQSVPDIVHMALEDFGVKNTTYRMLLHNNDEISGGYSQYWFQTKFLGVNEQIIVPETANDLGNQFCAQPTVCAEEAPEVGMLLFGCSSNFNVSNEERFALDRERLHEIVNYITKVTKFHKLGVMVVCYRSPIDTEPADPSGLDRTRTLGQARRQRIELVKDALGFSAFNDMVVGKSVVMVETLRDLDMAHEIRKFSQDYILETISARFSVSPEGSPVQSKPTPEVQSKPTPDVQTKRKRQLQEESQQRVKVKRPREAPVAKAPARRKSEGLPVRTPVKQTANGIRRRTTGSQTPGSAPPSVYKTPSTTMKGDYRLVEASRGHSPLNRYLQKKAEEVATNEARMKAKNMLGLSGFQMVLKSPTTPAQPVPQKPKVDTSKLESSISELDRQLAEFDEFMRANALPASMGSPGSPESIF